MVVKHSPNGKASNSVNTIDIFIADPPPELLRHTHTPGITSDDQK
jgi:hypothetical protein